MRKININKVESIFIGNAEDKAGATGITAIICPDGMTCGIDIRGGGPASRETELLSYRSSAQTVHAIVLGGGSAFGLDAAGGVMKYLEEHDIGFDTGVTKVPLVCQSDIFDLCIGDKNARPDFNMGYKAAKNAFEKNYRDGNYGVGTGATVGKLYGVSRMMKTGVGSATYEIESLKIGAIVVVNALGDVYENSKIIAGLLTDDLNDFANSYDEMLKNVTPIENKFVSNTTIGVLITNAQITKNEASKIASMAHGGIIKSIAPVNTSADGDTVYAVGTGEVKADIDLIGTLGAEIMREAVLCAVKSAESAYGLKCAADFEKER